jgi:hypothetical protein
LQYSGIVPVAVWRAALVTLAPDVGKPMSVAATVAVARLAQPVDALWTVMGVGGASSWFVTVVPPSSPPHPTNATETRPMVEIEYASVRVGSKCLYQVFNAVS